MLGIISRFTFSRSWNGFTFILVKVDADTFKRKKNPRCFHALWLLQRLPKKFVSQRNFCSEFSLVNGQNCTTDLYHASWKHWNFFDNSAQRARFYAWDDFNLRSQVMVIKTGQTHFCGKYFHFKLTNKEQQKLFIWWSLAIN